MDPDLASDLTVNSNNNTHLSDHSPQNISDRRATSSGMTTSTAAAKAQQSSNTTTACIAPGDDADPLIHAKGHSTAPADSVSIRDSNPATTASTAPKALPTASPRASSSSSTSAMSTTTLSERAISSTDKGSKPSLAEKDSARSMSLSSSSGSSVSDLFRRQSSTPGSTRSSSSKAVSPSFVPSKNVDHKHGHRPIGFSSFLLWLREHPSSSNVGSENLARFLLVKSVSLMAACLGCVYGLVFDRQPIISICSVLLFFLPAVQSATGRTRTCGFVLSLALAIIFLSFQTRSMPLVGPSLETTLLFGLPLVTGMLVGRKVGLATCLAVISYSIEEYRSKIKNVRMSEEEASRLWAGFGAYWISLLFIGAMTCLYQWCVEVCVRDVNLFKDIAVANAKSKDGVVSSVSHELRTPLAALIGWTELLMSDQTLSASAQSTVSLLHSSTLSLLTILNALLDVSKVSAAKMTNCSQNFNLHDLVLDTARMMTGLSGTRTVELLVDFSAQVPELVRADPGIIKQVLGNLISNAIKFTDVGYVNVGVSLKEEDDDSVTVEFVVQDTGKGIADEQKDKLFHEFSQVEGGKCKSHEAGTGLGLFLVKNLVEIMEGTVFVTSEVGVGSTFGFVIKMEKQFLAFRTPGYDHVVTVSSAFQSDGILEMDQTSPKLPVTPGLARSATPLAFSGVKITPVSTPVGTPKELGQGGDYFTLQPSEVTRANANNITLRTRDHAFLSSRQYYLHSQCGYFEDFLWNTATGRWRAQGVRRLSYDECIYGWQTDFGVDDSLASLGDIFLIDISPTTNRPKCALVLTDQDHTRLFLMKLSQLLIARAKERIGKARQASIILFYPFGHPPSLAQEPLLTLGQHYQISLCRKPVTERALGAIIKKQVITIQAAVNEGDSSCPDSSLQTASGSSMTSGPSMASSVSSCKKQESIPSKSLAQDPEGTSRTSISSKSPLGSTDSLESSGQSSVDSDRNSSPELQTMTQASHVRFAKRNGSAPKLALAAHQSSSSSIEDLPVRTPAVVDKPAKSLLKRSSINSASKTRPGLATKSSVQDLNATGKRILIVDDNSFNRNLLFHQLKKLGVSRVDQAGSGQEAVDKFTPEVHALVLMDLKMPIMGGFQATTLIREKELAHWGPEAMSALDTSRGSPVLRPINESWIESRVEKCPWSPERFVGPAVDLKNRRRSSISSASTVGTTKDASNKDSTKSTTVRPATVIAVTADWTAEIGEDRERALSGGFDDVMVKPISLPSLSVLLERYMEYRD